MKKYKFTRPPAPWIRDLDISTLKQDCHKKRHLAHENNSDENWSAFRSVRNLLKTKIKSAKRLFFKTALSSKKLKEVWEFIHSILNPRTI